MGEVLGQEIEYWATVVTTAPLLALAAVVELRVVRWHKLGPSVRWLFGLFASLAMIGLASAMIFGLQVMADWNKGSPPALDNNDAATAFACLLLGIALVVLLPTTQLGIIVFADVPLAPIYRKFRRLDRGLAKHAREVSRSVAELQHLRMLLGETLVAEVIANPLSVFVPDEATYRLDVRNDVVRRTREEITELDIEVRRRRKHLKKVSRHRKKMHKRYIKTAGSMTAATRRGFSGWGG